MYDPEDDLLTRFRQKEKGAFEAIYDRYAPALYGIVTRIVQNETLAQDVLQESFVKIWNNADHFDPAKGTIFTWLLNIARNTAIDKTRTASFRRRRNVKPVTEEAAQLITSSPAFDTDHIGIKTILQEELEEKYRQVIDLIYFEGMTQKEVQEYLGIPLGTVKSRTRIALRELRRIFQAQYVNLALWILISIPC